MRVFFLHNHCLIGIHVLNTIEFEVYYTFRKNTKLRVYTFSQVWKLLPHATPIANFRGHCGRLFSVAWSTENDDVIYSGADDFCLHTWRISAQMHTTPPAGNNSPCWLAKYIAEEVIQIDLNLDRLKGTNRQHSGHMSQNIQN